MNPNSDPNHTFSIPLSPTKEVSIKIHVSRLRAQGLDLTPWPSSYVLARLLHTFDIPIPALDTGEQSTPIPILELGAGIGLVGLVASLIWQRRSVITDLEPIVPGLMHNIRLNSDLLEQHHTSSTAGTLDWNQPDTLVLSNGKKQSMGDTGASIILAADTIYDENHPGMLARTILKCLAQNSDSRCILTFPLRVAYLDHIRELWELLETGGLVATEEGKAMAEGNKYDWDDERLCEWSIWRWKKYI